MRQKKSKLQYLVCHKDSDFGQRDTFDEPTRNAVLRERDYLKDSKAEARKQFSCSGFTYAPNELIVWLFQDGQPLWKIPYGPDEE